MKRRELVLLLVVVVVAALIFEMYFHFRNRAVISQPDVAAVMEGGTIKSAGASPVANAGDVASVTQSNKVFRVLPDQILAKVNGTPLTLRELIPLSTNVEQEISQEVYDYFLERAINRELILQTAKAQGVTLTESQERHLEKLRDLRTQSEPGLVSKLTVNAAEIEFELRDANAFMLQTSLMERSGATPNVTSEQVEQYYKNHISEFGKLPADPQARQEAWQKIDFEIRGQLAVQTRNQYNQDLQVFMEHLKTSAQITITPQL